MAVPAISVIIPCYNAERWIRESLQSAFRQGIPDMEVIVVDDGSTDRSPQIIQAEFPSVRLVRLARTGRCGPSRARNEGTRLATGRYIQYLDADDWLEPGKMALQMEALERTGADIAYGDWIKVRQMANGGETRETIRRQISGQPAAQLLCKFWCPPATYLFRRGIASKNPWREDFPMIEDVRFALDCVFAGAQLVYCPGVMASYRISYAGSLSRSDQKVFEETTYRNITEIRARWLQHGGLDEECREALADAYDYVARTSFFIGDMATFEAAYRDLQKIHPGYLPGRTGRLAAVARFLGYRNALRMSRWRQKVSPPR